MRRTIGRLALIGIIWLPQARLSQAGDMTLAALSRGDLNALGGTRGINNDQSLGASFVIYCNDSGSGAMTIGGGTDAQTGLLFGQLSDIATRTDTSGIAGPALTAYENAVYLTMRIGKDTDPEFNAIDKLFDDIQQVLWRLFGATSGTPSAKFVPGAAVDWMVLAHGESSSFDYSKWRF